MDALERIEEAIAGALTLAEGLELEELGRSRFTRREILRQLRAAASGLSQVSPEALPELDWEGWRKSADRLCGEDAAAVDDALWSVVHGLGPATLVWLRLYRAQLSA